jgi:hypothetical protein
LGEWCFFECGSLSSVTIESDSKLSRIGRWAFYGTVGCPTHPLGSPDIGNENE